MTPAEFSALVLDPGTPENLKVRLGDGSEKYVLTFDPLDPRYALLHGGGRVKVADLRMERGRLVERGEA